jgi:hypothetical protein
LSAFVDQHSQATAVARFLVPERWPALKEAVGDFLFDETQFLCFLQITIKKKLFLD